MSALDTGLGSAAREAIAGLVHALVERQLTVVTAESLTGGLASYLIVDVPDSGQVMLGAITAYATEEKERLLGVHECPVVSARCAAQMVAGVIRAFRADCAMSFTGVAGPAEQEGQPVGTVFIGVGVGDDCEVLSERFDGDPDAVRLQAIAAGARRLQQMVVRSSDG